jgi:hypothetical protein
MTNAYIRLALAVGGLAVPPCADRQAPQDNWVRCRQCDAEAAHVRALVHEPDCLGQRVWRDGAWHWPEPRP